MDLILKSALSTGDKDVVPPGKSVNVLLLYEERGFVNSTMELLREAAAKVHQDISMVCAIWDFDFVTEPLLTKVASREASAANMVVVVLRSGEGLPDSVKGWLNLWLWAHPSAFAEPGVLFSNWQYFDCAPTTIDSQLENAGEFGDIQLFTLGGTGFPLAAFKRELPKGAAREASSLSVSVHCEQETEAENSGDSQVQVWIPTNLEQEQTHIFGYEYCKGQTAASKAGPNTSLKSWTSRPGFEAHS